MKTLLIVLLLLAPIHHLSAQEGSVLDTVAIDMVTDHDSILVKYFRQFNPHTKKVRLDEVEVKSHLNVFFNKVYAKNTALEKINQKIYADSIAAFGIYQRTDTLIFNEQKGNQLRNSILRNKAIGITYIGELVSFNALNGGVTNIDARKLNAYIEFLTKTNIDWSAEQKAFIDKIIQNARYNLAYLDIVTGKFYRLLKEKRLTRSDLIKLKQDYKEPIQQRFISETMAKLNWQ